MKADITLEDENAKEVMELIIWRIVKVRPIP